MVEVVVVEWQGVAERSRDAAVEAVVHGVERMHDTDQCATADVEHRRVGAGIQVGPAEVLADRVDADDPQVCRRSRCRAAWTSRSRVSVVASPLAATERAESSDRVRL
jgi:hypothetical protein